MQIYRLVSNTGIILQSTNHSLVLLWLFAWILLQSSYCALEIACSWLLRLWLRSNQTCLLRILLWQLNFLLMFQLVIKIPSSAGWRSSDLAWIALWAVWFKPNLLSRGPVPQALSLIECQCWWICVNERRALPLKRGGHDASKAKSWVYIYANFSTHAYSDLRVAWKRCCMLL